MENKNMDKQKNNLIRSLSIVIVIVWLFIVIINATLSFTEGVAFIDHCLVWSTLSAAPQKLDRKNLTFGVFLL